CFPVPDRPEDLLDMHRLNVLNLQLADYGVSIGLQGRRPLSRVLDVLPTHLVGVDVALSAFLEGQRLGRLSGPRSQSGGPFVDRVNSVLYQRVGRAALLSGLLEA